jgi:chromosome segregation ATPase
MRNPIIGLILGMIAVLAPIGGAQAQSETDRLREALRTATAQSRSLEDQRTALQAKLTDAERERTALRADIKRIEKQQRDAIEDFNKRLAERDETLDKWKVAYEEAANVARAKDAERAKFEGEATAFKASTKSCLAKNAAFYKAGRELLQQYRSLTIGDAIAGREPVLAFKRVEVQNLLQDYHDKMLEQKAVP